MPTIPTELRRATVADVNAIALLHRSAFVDALPWIAELHSAEEDQAFFGHVVREQEVVVIEVDGNVAAFAAWSAGWLNHLYVLPAHQGVGLGRQLLEHVKDIHAGRAPPADFTLWTFQRNQRARRFYEVNGLVPVEFTGGERNEEQEPDLRYVWRSLPS